ncbi:MAG: lamin tail domain-containing protein [Verrucomicrobia bacterium]|nr:lamin tail domain-containing protein [Verrucomicrobiota bacterium]
MTTSLGFCQPAAQGFRHLLGALTGWLALTLSADAAAPPNDNFANGTILRGRFIVAEGTTVGATHEAGEPYPYYSSGANSSWWFWTAQGSGAVQINLTNSLYQQGGTYDTVIAVHTGNALNALSLVASNDDSFGLWSRVDFTAVRGVTYRIQIGGFSSQEGLVQLNLFGPASTNANVPPFVALAYPTSGTVLRSGDIPITTDAYDDYGGISNVTFHVDGVLVARDTIHPYTGTWTNAPMGDHQIFAVAMDNSGLRTTSSVATVSVLFNSKPTVALVSPTNDAAFVVPTGIFFEATADDDDGVARVDFYANSQLVGQADVRPYRYSWYNAYRGVYALQAVAVDNFGARATSAPVAITVTGNYPPNAYVYQPYDGQSFLLGAPISVYASGYDNDGVITNLVVFANGQPLAQIDQSVLTFTWSNAPLGVSILTALATDDSGATNTPSAMSITVTPAPTTNVLVAAGADWKYLDDGSNQGTAWRAPVFDDSSWSNGVAELGFGDAADGRPEATLIRRYNSGGQQIITYYFRRAFVVPDASRYDSLALLLKRDDGAVVYLNGTEIRRDNMPSGTITATTFASGSPSDDGATFRSSTMSASALVSGTNVVAVEMHQNNSTSSDISFDLSLAGLSTGAASNGPPTVTLTSPTNGSAYALSGTVYDPLLLTLTAGAADEYGIARVEFYANDDYMGQDRLPPYTYEWYPTANNWVLTAVAVDGFGARATSAPVAITVTGNYAPYLFVSTPQSGISLSAPATIQFSAEVHDYDGTVSNVALFSGTNLLVLAPFSGNPFDFTWTNVPLGTYSFDFVATDNRGAVATSSVMSVSVVPNTPPLIALISPPDGAGFVAPASIALQATATDIDGVARVEFFAGANKLGESTASPYAFAWTSVPVGEYPLTAVTHDLLGLSATSAVVNVRVTNNAPPVVSITAPPENSEFDAPTNITIAASASDPDGNGIARVEFYGDGARLGDDTTEPFSFVWTNTPIGRRALWAIAVDGVGIRGTSAVVNLIVHGNLTPTVSITAPGNNATVVVPTNGLGTNVLITATAADADGSISNVQFFAGTTFLGEDATSPYSINWTNYALGAVALRAVATDNQGGLGTSAPVNITFVTGGEPSTLVAPGAVWRFLDDGSDQGTAWRTLAFDDSAWPSGPGQLGFSSGPAENDEATFLNRYGTNGQQAITYFFRRRFNVNNPAAYRSLTLQLKRDDGAVVYLNGVEIVRELMPSGTVFYYTLASNAQDDGVNFWPFSVTPALLVAGANVLAVEVHQSSTTSSDISFDLSLSGVTTNARPAIALTTPADGALFGAPADILLAATATDGDGTIANVTFYADRTNQLARLTNAPYSFTWQNVPIGTYALSAVAADNEGARATSQVATVFVMVSSVPTVASFEPAAGVVTNLTHLTVNFSEPIQGVNASDLLLNGVPATGVAGSIAAYTFSFPPLAEGPVAVTWAVDHGIIDREAPPKSFLGTGAGETVLYTLVDLTPPTVTSVDPVPGAALRVLTPITVGFSEPVSGMSASALLLDGRAARRVSGSLAGPYVFEFDSPATGAVRMAWAANHGIHDQSAARHAFAGGAWSYSLDPTAPAANVVINEIMFHPSSEQTDEEYVELFNRGAAPVDLTGWRLNRGVNFTFPSVMLPGGDFLVVAANTNAFAAKYPGVAHVVGNWRGTLRNSHDQIELEDAGGNRVNAVTYADEGDWAIRIRSTQYPQGWDWLCEADGLGQSFELMNPALPNDSGQNWASSLTPEGTPGRANSVASANLAPLVLNVAHAPLVPRSTDAVIVTARLLDEQPGVTVAVFSRNASSSTPPAFTATPMWDDGQHGDGLANDGEFGALLPAQADHAVVEFFVRATDAGGRTRAWPAPARQSDTVSFAQTCNALYGVDDSPTAGGQAEFRLVLTQNERNTLAALSRNSDAQMNATLITVDGVETRLRYNTGIRYRGAGTRYANPPNLRVLIPSDRTWNGVGAFNLNSQYTHAQVAGFTIASKAGLQTEWHRAVRIRVNGENIAGSGSPQFGSYVHQESRDADFADRHFPNDPGGNIYAGITGSHTARLAYLGTSPSDYLSAGYVKQSNGSENDWSDLIQLTDVLNNTPDQDYTAAVRQVVDMDEWMLYFALFTMTTSMETSLGTGYGDDFAMYRGFLDPRFKLLGHDWDTILNEGDTRGATNASLFRAASAQLPTITRFIRWPDFVPLYYAQLKRLCETVFAPEQLNPLLDQTLGSWVPQTTINNMKTFGAGRRNYVLSQIPTGLSISHSLGSSGGFPYTSTPTVRLSGRAHAIETRKVFVNDSQAVWSAWDARWTNTVTLVPGLNRVLVRALNTNDVEFERAFIDIWYYSGAGQTFSGAISADTTWTAAAGPYSVTANLTIGAGATLTIEPGTVLYLGSGVNLTVANGARLLAEGTATAPIRFTRMPGSTTSWGGITVNGGAGSPETRIAHALFEFNGSTALHANDADVFLDHLTFAATDRQYVSLDGSSFVVSDCVFPTATGSFELVHGTRGIKSGGRGLFLRNFFGAASGYNDVVDFTGGNRPGPAVQFINNVFTGSGDDHLDLDGTDAWVEGNIFLHVHKNGSPDTASAVSGGDDGARTSEVTIIGNLFYDCDHAAMAKQGNFFTLLNNTVVRQTKQGGTDTDSGVVCLADEGTAEGAGMLLEGNILYDIEKLAQNVTAAVVTFTNNLMPQEWSGPGGGNASLDPLFKHVPQLSETVFTNWAHAQILRQWFSLDIGSPALGAGPDGRDLGAPLKSQISNLKSQMGAAISGEPAEVTSQTNATLVVGPWRTGQGIPSAGWPDGAGFTHYKWRLDGGAWSAETPTATPITLTGLAFGPHRVEVTATRDAGLYQDDPAYGPDAVVTASRTWVVSAEAPSVRLNEILANNQESVAAEGRFPDLIELVNSGSDPVDLAGFGLSDNLDEPFKFTFPPGTVLAPGAYLVLYADAESTPPGLHTGWSLKQEGDNVCLFAANGQLVDSVSFGLQVPDFSIGRLDSLSRRTGEGQGEGSGEDWALTLPTFGFANVAVRTTSPRTLKINEWLASGTTPVADDFIELFNPESDPVALGGLFLTDNPVGAPARHRLAPLSFVLGGGFAVFIADGNVGGGANHLGFGLPAEQGLIGLFDADLSLIDSVIYGQQTLNVAQGRGPDGGGDFLALPVATPGAPNPAAVLPGGPRLVINEVLAKNISALTNSAGASPEYVELFNATANDLDLGGLSLSDSLASPRKYVFASGLVLPSGGYYLLFCDGSAPASATNTGFGIKANGDGVYLFDTIANGGSLLDSVTYGVQANDYSIGRVPSGDTNWVLTLPTPASANLAASLGDPRLIKVNEWMANPTSGDDWFELNNPNPQPVAISGLGLSDNLRTPASRLNFRIAPLSFLGTGLYGYERFIADNRPGNGPDHVTFRLDAGGESIGVSLPDATLIDSVVFGPQNLGVSEGRLPDGGTNIVRFPTTPTPADANFLPLTSVVINEVLTATPLGGLLEDAVELRNVSAVPVNLKNWCLSDALHNLTKFRITNDVIVPPGGYVVFYEYQFNAIVGDPSSFGLDGVHGDELYLSAADASGQLTGYRTSAAFGPADAGVSFGRQVNSAGQVDYVATKERTLGADEAATLEDFRTGTGRRNALPKIGPVIFSEIMYHPLDLPGPADNVRDEYVELQNLTGDAVPLFDPAQPTNTWRLRGGVDFNFPRNVTLAAGEQILVVSFDPANDAASLAAFHSAYSVASGTRLFGPYSGKLDNGGEALELRKPGPPVPAGFADSGFVPYITVERLEYQDEAPWDAAADGTGLSLHRSRQSGYGNEPRNWFAAVPTPGGRAGSGDFDQDGLPDVWEVAHQFNPSDPTDAHLDPDGDGMTNLHEYLAGTDPRDGSSVLRVTLQQELAETGTNVVLQFPGLRGRTYSVLSAETAAAIGVLLTDIDPLPVDQMVTVTHALPPNTPRRFYRVISPSLKSTVKVSLLQDDAGVATHAVVQFLGLAGQSYSVLSAQGLPPTWQVLTNLPPLPFTGVISVTNPVPAGATFHYYDVLTPTWP